MMLVDTFLAPSEIEGLGLFAAADIPAGTRIWRLDPGCDLVLTDERLNEMPDWQQNYFHRYSFKWNGLFYFCVDNARYMNHAAESNTYEEKGGTYASRDITAGEEITCDYFNLGETAEDDAYNFPPEFGQ
ncbi:MAG TPA: SET domain-containing protein-lysine N-methyltransferase [Candidatus Lokiarchaeia archaeon]|nr:SET domain-containing protein-lysine N-methyltransferase [Candidatus Lokiarchaeia archaeon]